MTVAVIFAIYFILWRLSLLIVLPWGAHNQDESGDVPLAPIRAHRRFIGSRASWSGRR